MPRPPIYLPATMVLTPGALPDLCPRHGRLAARQRMVTFASRPPLWVYLLLCGGVLPMLIAYMVVRKTLSAPVWSFCDVCLGRRRSLLIAMGVCLVVMATSLVSRSGPFIVITWAIGILALLVLGSSRGWVTIAAADVTRDGQALIVRKPDPGYVHQLPQPNSPRPLAPGHQSAPFPRTF
jgi:hypothetical protein